MEGTVKRKIELAALIIIALMGIFPPWVIKYKSLRKDLGYWWITNPPGYWGEEIHFYGQIDFERLILQWIVVAVVAWLVVRCVKKQEK
jgi:hypothetical protein